MGIIVEGGHLNADSSVSPCLVTFLVSEEIIFYCAASLGFGGGGGVCVSRLPWQKKGVNIAFSKGKPGIGLSPPPPNFQSRI